MDHENTFSVGDKVNFTITKQTSFGFNMASRKGEVESIDGVVAQIKYRGRIYPSHVNNITHANEKSPLTNAFSKAFDE